MGRDERGFPAPARTPGRIVDHGGQALQTSNPARIYDPEGEWDCQKRRISAAHAHPMAHRRPRRKPDHGVRSYTLSTRSGCCQRKLGNRLKSESVVTSVQPFSIAIAACWASATNLSAALDSRHSCSKIAMWLGPGPTTRAVGLSMSETTKSNAVSVVEDGSKIRRLVATRTNPASTSTDSAKGSAPVARRVSHAAYSLCSGVESSM